MLVSELAERAEVPVATVKYYLREGLLPPGRADEPPRRRFTIARPIDDVDPSIDRQLPEPQIGR